MNVGLFDLYTSGHHLPYANRVKKGLNSTSDVSTTFITLTENERCGHFFNEDEIEYLEQRDSPPIEDRDEPFHEIAETVLKEFFSNSSAKDYDVIHFLYTDDILGALWRHCPKTNSPRLIGELNGVFFKRGTVLRSEYIHPFFLSVLRTKAGGFVDYTIPERTNHESLWRDLYLYRCLHDNTFDHIVVHSGEAEEYVKKLITSNHTSLVNIPYPGPDEFGREISKEVARYRLNLNPDDQILLYFGTLRKEKGIDQLLTALRLYRGPSFTMVIAGPPNSVSEGDVRSTSREATVKIVSKLEYIETPEVYYRAADALILPYIREFGRECTSQTLDEACSALRPVIVPDFGAIGRITKEWNLGMTYENKSLDGLINAIELFANNGVQYSKEHMRQYNKHHSYERLATDLMKLYKKSD